MSLSPYHPKSMAPPPLSPGVPTPGAMLLARNRQARAVLRVSRSATTARTTSRPPGAVAKNRYLHDRTVA
jgi:hypothetical protein